MTDEDKKEKKEISQQKKILNEVVADKAALKGATTQYEKRMRLVHTLNLVMCSGSKSRVRVGFGYCFSGSGRVYTFGVFFGFG